jgi:hypothetical protein
MNQWGHVACRSEAEEDRANDALHDSSNQPWKAPQGSLIVQVTEVFGAGWQNGIVPVSINSGNFAGRAIPDVAANADPATGYFEVSGGKQGVVGGTSASAPLWASLIARINAVMKVNVGNFNALLYSQFGPSGILRDITVGNNDTDGLLNGQFPAGPGWDGAPPRLGAQREAALPRLRSPAGSERFTAPPAGVRPRSPRRSSRHPRVWLACPNQRN